jgi:hypothetical protein
MLSWASNPASVLKVSPSLILKGSSKDPTGRPRIARLRSNGRRHERLIQPNSLWGPNVGIAPVDLELTTPCTCGAVQNSGTQNTSRCSFGATTESRSYSLHTFSAKELRCQNSGNQQPMDSRVLHNRRGPSPPPNLWRLRTSAGFQEQQD